MHNWLTNTDGIKGNRRYKHFLCSICRFRLSLGVNLISPLFLQTSIEMHSVKIKSKGGTHTHTQLPAISSAFPLIYFRSDSKSNKYHSLMECIRLISSRNCRLATQTHHTILKEKKIRPKLPEAADARLRFYVPAEPGCVNNIPLQRRRFQM